MRDPDRLSELHYSYFCDIFGHQINVIVLIIITEGT